MRNASGWMVIAVLAGCQANPAAPDASVQHDSGILGSENCGGDPSLPDCALTCGNGQIDTCNRVDMLSTHCRIYIQQTEVCDTASALQCSSLGYYSGTATCQACTSFSDAICDACAPGSLACTNNQLGRALGLSVSQTMIAQPTTGGTVQLFDANGIATISVPIAATSLTATPSGWLVSSLAGIQTLAFDGTLGPVQAVLGPGATVAPGPVAGHYLELWRQGANRPVRAMLHDASGASVGAAFDTFQFDTGGELAMASDGVHAFLGLDGKLAMIGDDGSVAISTSGFPGFARATLTHATSSWYVAAESNDWSAQRFDSAGAPVGLAIHVSGSASSFLADGDDLLVVREGSTNALHAGPVQVVRYTTAGTVTATITVGADRPTGKVAELAHLGTNVVVSWSGPQGLNLARASAP